jgi:hypothetical protein
VLAAILAYWGCNLSDQAQGGNFVSLLVPDSLEKYDDVRILLLNTGSVDTLDTLWSGRVTNSSSLIKLPTKHYTGGMVDVVIQGKQGDSVAYLVLIRFRSPQEKPAIIELPLPKWPEAQEKKDTVPPVISLIGLDSVSIELGGILPDLKAACRDDVDSALAAIVSGEIERAKVGRYELTYTCKDKAGNVADPVVRIVYVVLPPDTVRPEIVLIGGDSITVFEGGEYVDSGSVCVDDRDTALTVQVEGAVDSHERGWHLLRFHCADAAGNEALEMVRHVFVARLPDTLGPVITLWGKDSITIYQGRDYVDSGSSCLDARDGTLPVQVQGSVDTGVRGAYELEFDCADSAGNAAVQKVRRIVVAREPDTIKPILTLRGPDTAVAYDHDAYTDSGAECTDARDGSLSVTVTGAVDTGLRGLQTLAFHCADSSGNTADSVRKVLVMRRPDSTNPILTLRGKDSMTVYEYEPYADSGAQCEDDRDGERSVSVTGAVNVSLRDLYSLTFHCEDSAGNGSDVVRKVNVVRVPDASKPVITLRGTASIQIPLGQPYTDSGASCLDDRDGNLPVTMQGIIDTGKADEYVLSFHCADSAGNSADVLTRTVKVKADLDLVEPIITLAGEDTIALISMAAFVDPGGTCEDAKDGALTLTRTGITPLGTAPGYYQFGYSCQDAAGNVRTAARTLKVGLFGAYLESKADAQIDTLVDSRNMGGTGPVCFVNEPGGNYFTLIRFDLAKVDKSGLKAAKLRFFAFGHGTPWPGTFADYTFRVYRLKSDWVEGTGNWFYYDGVYRNGGETWLQYYPMTDSGKAHSSNPILASGIQGLDRAIVRETNLTLIATRKLNLFFGAWNGNPNQVPPPENLTIVELDVTDYIRSTDPATDYGIVIKVDGVSAGRYMDFATRDLGNGSWAPRLMLEY